MKAKRFILMLLVMLMSVTGAWAEYVPYVDADGRVKTASAKKITSTSTSLSGGWYVVGDADVQTNFITCSGDVHIIIADGAKLTVTSSTRGRAGIIVTGSLTIYGQSNQTGQLIVLGGENAAGIGGNDFMSGSNITINGGIVTANGGNDGAGIGGGRSGDGSNITINGGIVTANGGGAGAGIGGGISGNGSNITINGGIVTANGAYLSAGIGGGYCGSGSYITINGGIVTATSDDGSGIGSGINGGSCSNIFVTPTLRVRADNNNPPANLIAHNSITDDIASSLNGKQYARITNLPFLSLRSDDESQGTVFGEANDEFAPNTEVTFCAIPAVGYKFSKWSDGRTQNPRRDYVVTDDTWLTAIFEPIKEFNDPKGAGMRLKLKKKDGNVYEFKTSEVESVDYYRVNE